MKIIIGRGACTILFGEDDGEYAGKELSINGEGNNSEFCISPSESMFWYVPDEVNPNRYIGITVDESEKENLLDYVIKEAKRQGYTLYIWK